MNKHTIYTFAVMIVALFVIILVRYNDYVTNDNFYLDVSTQCDPQLEQCFTLSCNSEEDPECDLSPYKKINILKADAPACLENHDCDNFFCGNIESCSIIYCSAETVEDWETCTEVPDINLESFEKINE